MAINLSSQLRDIILNTHLPLVFKDFPIHWQCFDDSLQDWCMRYDNASVVSGLPIFESIAAADCDTPQWERKRQRVSMTMQQFLDDYTKTRNENDAQTEWAAFQYKRAAELPESCLTGIDFKCFGFEEHQNDYSLWLGSKNANTPCHYDTYGVNIVVQVYGSKSWMLFPPETPLQSTRIPYEESSVYCLENFYAPAPDKLSHYEQFHGEAHHCLLHPGDVLIVPRHWWHYVEAVETSLSVNYWVPLKVDFDLTLDELIVKHVVESFVKGESEELKQYLLNPNQLDEVADSASSLFGQFEQAVHNKSTTSDRQLYDSDYMSQNELSALLSRSTVRVRTLDVMPREAYTLWLTNNSKRHSIPKTPLSTQSSKANNHGIINSTLELLINSMCAPRSVAAVKREFFRRLDNSKDV